MDSDEEDDEGEEEVALGSWLEDESGEGCGGEVAEGADQEDGSNGVETNKVEVYTGSNERQGAEAVKPWDLQRPL